MNSGPARRLAEAGLALGVLLPLASLPWFGLGYWSKAEPLAVGLHLCGALAGAGLALASPAMAARAMAVPAALVALALAAWTLLAAPFVGLPVLSWSGAPESGFGGAWSLDLALLIGAARLVRSDPAAWRRLRRLAICVVAAIAAIKLRDQAVEAAGEASLLIWVSAYYGWLGLCLPALILGEEKSRPWLAAGLVATLAALVAGRSMAAFAAAALGVATMLWVRRRPGWAPAWPAMAAIAPGLLLIIVPQARAVASLDDRLSLLRMGWAEISAWPWQVWITGLGWGRTQDVFAARLGASGQTLWDGSWIFMASDYFHAHNALAESLLAAGLPGLALTLAAMPAVVLAAPPARRALAAGLAAALAAMGALWFPLALSLPLFAMAAAAQTPELEPASDQRGGLGTRAGLAAAAAALLVLAATLAQFGLAMERWRDTLEGGAPLAVPRDPRGSDWVAASVIRDAFKDLERLAPQRRAEREAGVKAMAAHLAERIPVTDTMAMPVTGLALMSQIRTLGSLSWIEPWLPPLGPVWMAWSGRALALAPGRSDLLIPMLSEMAARGRYDLAAPWVSRLLARDPRDPVGLYFKGLLEVVKPEPEAKRAGLAALRASLDAGVERLMPVDEGVKALLAKD